jgi:hypothetical protein
MSLLLRRIDDLDPGVFQDTLGTPFHSYAGLFRSRKGDIGRKRSVLIDPNRATFQSFRHCPGPLYIHNRCAMAQIFDRAV